MKNITCFLVDDIEDNLIMLEQDLHNLFPELKVIGKAKSVVEAAKELHNSNPDIIFLDIMLGDGTGFDLLEIYPNLKAKIIFVTASDEYAIKAFKFAAIDYVLKPYSDEDIKKAVNKAIQQLQPNKNQLDVLQEAFRTRRSPKKISLHTQDKISVVTIENIVRCQSDDNYTKFYLQDGTSILVSKTLKYFADLLIDSNFIRVHQSHLVNLKYIKEYIKSDGGYLLLVNKETVPVSVRKRAELIDAIQKF